LSSYNIFHLLPLRLLQRRPLEQTQTQLLLPMLLR
jgi:hypothetical protein